MIIDITTRTPLYYARTSCREVASYEAIGYQATSPISDVRTWKGLHITNIFIDEAHRTTALMYNASTRVRKTPPSRIGKKC